MHGAKQERGAQPAAGSEPRVPPPGRRAGWDGLPHEASLTARPPRRLRRDASRGLTDLLISLNRARGSRPERGDGGPLGNAGGREPPSGERGGERSYRRGPGGEVGPGTWEEVEEDGKRPERKNGER